MSVSVYFDCDRCGNSVYADDAIVLCEECYEEKIKELIAPGYHLCANGELYCHKEKSTMQIREEDDQIIFCPFCGDRLVK